MSADEDTMSTKRTWIPNVEESQKPIVGKTVFTSLEEAYDFYNEYARHAGFSIRSGSCKYEKKHDDEETKREVLHKRFTCSKEGQTDNKVGARNIEVKRKWSETRESCPALMAISKERNKNDSFHKFPTRYVVQKFIEEHSHELASPHKKHLLKSHRSVTKAKKNMRNTFDAANIPTSQTMVVLEIESGGYENIGCTERDLRNYDRDKRQEAKGHDAQLLQEHFEEMQELEPSFTFELKVDDKNKLTHFFWADPVARYSSNHFGDVIVFDTTYNTNQYGLIFAPFTGVNHHGQSITLGCGFLQNETTESFIWLFETWVKVMPGGPPKAIITDQDAAMAKAISIVFPNTFHRFCIWHIMQKVPAKMGGIANREAFISAFKNCVWNSETPQSFEQSWSEVIRDYGLENNAWLTSLYNIRHKWIPAFLRHIFFAGMSSSQRSESMNSFFRKYVSKRNSLMEFIIRFNRAVARQRQNELIADHETLNSRPKLKTPCDMEKVMGDTYTRKLFYKFQAELYEGLDYVAEIESQIEDRCVYKVYKIGRLDGINYGRLVDYKVSTKLAVCGCLKFEFQGIPCRHVLCVLRHHRINYLPDHYILKRWTKHARVGSVYDENGIEIKRQQDSATILRRNDLAHISISIFDEAAESEEGSKLLREKLYEAYKELKALKLKPNIEITEKGRKKDIGGDGKELFLCEPEHSKTKGTGKRMISVREKAIKGKKTKKGNHHAVLGARISSYHYPPSLEGFSDKENEETITCEERSEENDRIQLTHINSPTNWLTLFPDVTLL